MTDTNRPEAVHDVLRDMRQWKGDYSVFADRIERALSARASAGEGGAECGESLARNEAFNLADTVIEHIRCGQEQKARDAIMEAFTAPQPAQAGAGGELRAWVGDMKTSAGMDYYVCVGRDTGNPFDRTYLTPHKYSIRGRAEYDVAQWNHLLGHGTKPDILAFDTQPTPASPATGDAWTYPNRNALIREVCEGLRGYRFDVDPVCVMAIINSIPAQVFSRMAPPALTADPQPATGEEDSPQDISWWVRRLKVQEAITDKYVARVAELESSQPAAAQGEWVLIGYEYQHDETGRTTFVELQQYEWGWENNNKRWTQVGPCYRPRKLAAAPQPQEAPVPVRIDCPQCTAPHVDEGEWATRPHKTHQCQACGHEWRPFPYATVGTPPAQATVKESLTVHPARGDGEGECKCACRTMANGMVHSHDCCAAPKNRDMAAGLYHAVNRMMAALGADGEISTRHPATQEVMAALTAIDGGQYMASAMHEVSDVQMAMHWIDRYASGIDDEPQFDRIAEALWHMHSAEADDALTTRPTPEADARDGRPTMRELIDVLPGVYYMAPPDGGSVSLLEQLQRMAQDAARYRWLRERDVLNVTYGVPHIAVPASKNNGEFLSEEDADAAIDAAAGGNRG